MPSPIQYALAIECLLNIVGGLPFLFTPELYLSTIITRSTPSKFPNKLPAAGHIPESTIFLFRLYAIFPLGLTFPLLYCIPDFMGVGMMRKFIFQTLVVCEAGILGLMMWGLWSNGGDSGIGRGHMSGFSDYGLGTVIGSFILLLSWRFFGLVMRPGILEGEEEKNKMS